MTFDLTHQLVDPDGNPALDENGKPAEFKKVVGKALLTDTADNAKSKFERFELYLKTKLAGAEVELSAEEAKLIKEAASVYNTFIAGQIAFWTAGKKL
jgi:hypothetical protein